MSRYRLPLAAIILLIATISPPVTGIKSVGAQSPPPYSIKNEDADPAKLAAADSRLRPVIDRYMADLTTLQRYYVVESSPVRRAKLQGFYGEWQKILAGMNFDSLRQDEQIDYILFRNYIEHEVRELDLRGRALDEMAPLIPFSKQIAEYEESRKRMEKIDPGKIAAQLNDLNKQIAALQKAVETGLLPEGKADPKLPAIRTKKPVANRAFVVTSNLRETLKRWFEYYNGYDPLFTWWNEQTYKAVDQSLQNYATFLREKVVGVKITEDTAIIGDPIGRDRLLSELAYEMIPYTPEEILAIADKEFAWCEAEMKKASRELGFGDDWKKALEFVKNKYVEPGKQPELVRMLAEEALTFLDKNDLVTVPELARETWRMEMLSPRQQLVSPFFLGGEYIQVSYPTNTMSHEAKMMSMRGNNPHFSRATVHHELFPGHGLQAYMTRRYRSYRSLFGTPFWGEGWSLYWEFLLWDMKFPQTPEDRIGFLFWRSHRCARIIFSLSFHLEKMTPQQCIDLLVNRVGHEVDNATAEVRRSFAGNYGPLYQAAYMLGGLQFYSLHRELVDSGKMKNRDFHDAILMENRIPVEMVRAILTKQKLTKDYKTSWKFYKF
ncbi:MAG: DUF885 family protein [Acidobacteria bacterium]|nr:DUF885 family protein [Acidobacteriota bacterium]